MYKEPLHGNNKMKNRNHYKTPVSKQSKIIQEQPERWSSGMRQAGEAERPACHIRSSVSTNVKRSNAGEEEDKSKQRRKNPEQFQILTS